MLVFAEETSSEQNEMRPRRLRPITHDLQRYGDREERSEHERQNDPRRAKRVRDGDAGREQVKRFSGELSTGRQRARCYCV